MASTLTTGYRGEDLAANFLRSKGFSILERNWHHRHKEIDLIVTDKQFLRIVEVKCRTYPFLSEPHTAVHRTKQKALIAAAHAYVCKRQIDMEVRFDIVSIVLFPQGPQIKYFPDAFYPVL